MDTINTQLLLVENFNRETWWMYGPAAGYTISRANYSGSKHDFFGNYCRNYINEGLLATIEFEALYEICSKSCVVVKGVPFRYFKLIYDEMFANYDVLVSGTHWWPRGMNVLPNTQSRRDGSWTDTNCIMLAIDTDSNSNNDRPRLLHNPFFRVIDRVRPAQKDADNKVHLLKLKLMTMEMQHREKIAADVETWLAAECAV